MRITGWKFYRWVLPGAVKYKKTRWNNNSSRADMEGHWVLGGYERDTKKINIVLKYSLSEVFLIMVQYS